MTLVAYYEAFHRYATGEPGCFPAHVAAEVAAAHEVGMTFEQLKLFLARRTEISSVAVALISSTLSAEAIERILNAKRDGAIYRRDVLARAFSPPEVHDKFRVEGFGHGD